MKLDPIIPNSLEQYMDSNEVSTANWNKDSLILKAPTQESSEKHNSSSSIEI
jgi:hypothetical protein